MMHRLLQEMGRSIVYQESPKDPAKRSRVWRNRDSFNVLKNTKGGGERVEGLALDMQMLADEDVTYELKSNLKTDSLKKMHNLKLLQLNYVQLAGSYENFSEDLRWLCWLGFHLRNIPSDLSMRNLVAIDMSYSNLEVFEPPMVLQSLQVLNLKDSRNLFEIRNMSRIPNLETLILWNCDSLVRVCETIKGLTSLALVNMTGCRNLFKREEIDLLVGLKASTSDGGSTQQPSFPLPRSLQRLFLKDCYLECTDYCPLSFMVQPLLQYLNLGNSLFEFLPYYDHLKNLRVLDLSLCSRLKWLVCLPSTLAELYVYYCESLEKITFQSPRFTLQEFGYEGCINLSEIEGFIKLVPLAKLDESDLGHLKWLKEYQNHEVCLVGDDELTMGRSWCVQMLYEFDIMSTSLPDIKDPNMMPEYMSKYPSLSFDVPSCPNNRRLKGLNVTFKYTLLSGELAWFAKISTNNGVDLMYNPKVFAKPVLGEFVIWLSYWPIGNTLDVGDKVNVSIVVMSGLEVCECGASLVYTDDEVVADILENNMRWVEILGGDLSGFQLSTGAYYLCRRDFFELMEVGRLTPDWFRILVGGTIDYTTEVRGWRKNGRPKLSDQSYTELKTVRCIIYGPESEEIYKIPKLSKTSFVDKTLEFTSSTLKEILKPATVSEFSDDAEKTLDLYSSDLYSDLYSDFNSDKAFYVDDGSEEESTTVSSESEKDVNMPEASQVNETMELSSSSLKEEMESAIYEFSRLPIKEPSDTTSPWAESRNFGVYLSFSMFDVGYFGVHLNDALVREGYWISPYFSLLPGGGHPRTVEVDASIVVLSESYICSSWDLDMLLLVLEQRRNSNHFVLPVFYGLESLDLRVHGKAFLLQAFQGSRESMEKVDRWYTALKEVVDLPGINMSWHGDEPTIIEVIVSIVRHALYSNPVHAPPQAL